MSVTALTPLDGRYADKVKELSPIFSEWGLFQYRLRVEVEYLIALSSERKIKEVRALTVSEAQTLKSLYEQFTDKDATRIKSIEKKTNHDVKAVEYYIKEKLAHTSLQDLLEFIHFGLTSEDVNNLAYTMMLRDGVSIYKRYIKKILAALKQSAVAYRRISLLALTHGQPASPTTVGKEFAVFYFRLKQQLAELNRIEFTAKFSGATGNWNAQYVAYPSVDWIQFSKRYIESFDLVFHPLTTQIEPHDSAAEIYQAIIRLNTIIKDFDRDVWLYISRGVFKQKKVKGEVGSSTMPHKVNPIDFENSEGNVGMANALLEHLASKLPVSRLQRDLTDSTVLRNQGVALGYALLALQSTLKGLGKLEVDAVYCQAELDNHWEVLAEPVQTVMRKSGIEKPYEKLKHLTRGAKVTKAELHKFVRNLDISRVDRGRLLKLTPQNYTGLAAKLVDRYVK